MVSTDRSSISGRALQDIRAPALIDAAVRPNLARYRLSPCYMPYRSLFARSFSPVPAYIFDKGIPFLAFFPSFSFIIGIFFVRSGDGSLICYITLKVYEVC